MPSLRVASDDRAARPGYIVAPHHVDQPQVHLAAVKPSEAEAARHHLRDQAYRQHSLHDDFRKAELDRLRAIVVIIARGAGERVAHRLGDRAHRSIESLAAALTDLEGALLILLARLVDDETFRPARLEQEALMSARARHDEVRGVGDDDLAH